MTLTAPSPGTKVLRDDGGMNQPWYQVIVAALASAVNSASGLSGLGSAATKNIATEAEVRAYADAEKVITTAAVRAAAAFEPLTFANPVAIDWEDGATRSLVMIGDAALGNPTNAIPGTFLTIYVVGDSASVRELTYASSFGGTHPATDDIDNATAYVLTILCVSASHFVVSAIDASPP